MPGRGHLEGSTPIPAPRHWPSVIYCKPGARSLQSQMRLDNDYWTFAKLMWLIRHVAARHVNLTVRYSRQDPAKLAKIEEEILSQSTVLRDDYVNAWPITSYLRIALKTHTASGPCQGVSKRGRQKLSRDERCYKYHKERTWAKKRLSQRIADCANAEINYAAPAPAGTEDPPLKSTAARTPWSAQLSNYMRRYDKGREQHRTNAEEDSERVPSRGSSEVAINAIERDLTEAPESSYSDDDSDLTPDPTSRAVTENYVIPDVGYVASQENAEGSRRTQQGHSVSPNQSASLQASNVSMFRESPPKVVIEMGRNGEGTRLSDTTTIPSYRHGPTSVPDRSISSYFVLPTPSPSEAETEAIILDPPNDILGMLLEYELPYADAERIVELLGTLGIGDTQYLRVLGNMASCDVWLQELRADGKLSEIQLRVLREILDQLARDLADDEDA